MKNMNAVMEPNIKHILLIDDDKRYRRMLKRFFGKLCPKTVVDEIDPLTETSSTKKIDWAEYDLLLLDYHLNNGETGIDWLRKNRSNNCFPATIVLTGQGTEETALQAFRFGAHDYLRKKDLTVQELTKSVGRAIDKWNEEKKKADTQTMKSTIFNRARLYRKLVDIRGNAILLLIAIDQYHEIHNAYGLAATDNLIAHISKITGNNLASLKCNVTRIGDANIAALIDEYKGNDHGEAIAKTLCGEYDNYFTYADKSIYYTVSIGLVKIKTGACDPEEILAQADAACCQANSVNHNSFEICKNRANIESNDHAGQKSESDELESQITSAISENRLQLNYQPLVGSYGELIETMPDLFEARISLSDTQGQNIPADIYTPVLKRNNLLQDMDKGIIKHCVETLSNSGQERCRKSAVFMLLTEDSIVNGKLHTWLEKLASQLQEPAILSSIIFQIRTQQFLANRSQASLLMKTLRDKFNITFSLIDITNIEILKTCTANEYFEFIKFTPGLIDKRCEGNDVNKELREISGLAESQCTLAIADRIEDSNMMTMAVNSKVNYIMGNFVLPPQDSMIKQEVVIM